MLYVNCKYTYQEVLNSYSQLGESSIKNNILDFLKINFYNKNKNKTKTTQMKKFILTAMIATTLFACVNTTDEKAVSDYPSNAVGYNLDSSASIDLVMKMAKSMESLDTATYRSTYAPDAIFHDNLDSMNLDQNISMISLFNGKGITVKIEEIKPIWEAVNKVPSEKGITNYVISFQSILFTKGDKQVKVIINSVDAIKDGKITEEWLVYDTKLMSELLK